MSTHPSILELALRPALDVYAAALAEHRHDWSTGFGDTPPRCTCGWTPKRPTLRRPSLKPGASLRIYSRNGVGLHIAAAEKRAEKVYDEASTAIIAAHVRETAR